MEEKKIVGKIRSNPEKGKNGSYQQTVWLLGEDLAAMRKALDKLKAEGKTANSPTSIYGNEERGYYIYVPVSGDVVANPKGSGRQVDNIVTLVATAKNGWVRFLAMVPEDIKAKNDAKKAAALAKEVEQAASLKTTISLFSSLGLDKKLVALQLLSQETGGTLNVAETFKVLSSTSAPVTRSSRLDAANGKEKEPAKSLAGAGGDPDPDPHDLDGSEDVPF